MKAIAICIFKFDCEWEYGMGPQGLGMVYLGVASGLLAPTVPWVHIIEHSQGTGN